MELWQKAKDRGDKIPRQFSERIDPDPGLYFYADAFWRLNNDRQLGAGLGPISFLSIDAYGRRYGIDDLDEFDRFLSIIRAMDAEYLQLRNPKADSEIVDEVEMDKPAAVRSLLMKLAKKPEESTH